MQENEILTSVVIDAPPALVWEILTAFDQYGRWHPTLEFLAGRPAQGAELSMRIAAGTPAERSAQGAVVAVDAPSVLAWEGGVPELLWGHHRFELAEDGAGTRLVNREAFSGSMAARVMAEHRELVTAEFDAANQALKRHAEERRRRG